MERWLIGAAIFVGVVALSLIVTLVVRWRSTSDATTDRVIMIAGTGVAILASLATAVLLGSEGGDPKTLRDSNPTASESQAVVQPPDEEPSLPTSAPAVTPHESGESDQHSEFDKFLSNVDEITVGEGNRFDLDSGRLNEPGNSADVRLSFSQLNFGAQYRMSSKVRAGWIDNLDLPDCAGRARLKPATVPLSPTHGDWETESVCVHTTSGQWMLLRVLEGKLGASDVRFRYGPLRN